MWKLLPLLTSRCACDTHDSRKSLRPIMRCHTHTRPKRLVPHTLSRSPLRSTRSSCCALLSHRSQRLLRPTPREDPLLHSGQNWAELDNARDQQHQHHQQKYGHLHLRRGLRFRHFARYVRTTPRYCASRPPPLSRSPTPTPTGIRAHRLLSPSPPPPPPPPFFPAQNVTNATRKHPAA